MTKLYGSNHLSDKLIIWMNKKVTKQLTIFSNRGDAHSKLFPR